ncbi:MAG: single-stranded DNA-binding protein [Coraliomargarita sp. TMED73]|jgi:hypothetical protein|nr:MAG: single-stranded DNA-binding protein [Coraliomargarita sp. TMED73]|tara:strand:- start:38 stop:979 length:942 start_codon:yes stop_codon:yes gene_type:complete
MTESFSSLKRSSRNNLEKLMSETNKIAKGNVEKGGADDRFWKPEVDKAGNGYAVIRFLPAPSGEDIPWVRVFDHGFQGVGGWYIENSLTTLNKKDPVSEYNSKLWNSGIEANKEQARKQKRRLKYIANIYVVKDPANPQNEGKVFLYQFGKKIFDKINDLMNPQFEDEDPINPFDFWEGANFKLKIRNVEGYRNYDKSEFETSSTLGEFEDEELETVWKQQHSLAEFTAPENFKSYEELEAKLNKVLGLDGAKPVPKGRAADEEELDEVQNFRPSASASVGKTASVPKADEIPWDTDSEDDSLSFFENLAKED